MQNPGLVGFLVIGGMAGWIAGTVMRGRGFGIIRNIVVGLVSAFLSGFRFRLLGFSAHGLIGLLIMVAQGAIVLPAVIGSRVEAKNQSG